jgi:general secretion pathway protein E
MDDQPGNINDNPPPETQADAERYLGASDYPEAPPMNGRFSVKFMKNYRFFPFSQEGDSLKLVMADPEDKSVIEEIGMLTGLEIIPYRGDEGEILEAIDRFYGEGATTIRKIMEDMEEGEEEASEVVPEQDVDHLREVASEAPVIRMVNLLISRAVEAGASDIHFEPFEDRLIVRNRIDGILHEVEAPPKRLQPAVISRVKIMARMNIAERRLPQDGRIRMKVKDGEIDIRVSTVPTIFGESLVLRLLDRSSVFIGLDDLGFEPEILQSYERLIMKPYGMILVTGPTGSGKTTTLYAALDKINSEEKKIITIEDPVEYQLEGINQIQVKPKIGLDFADGLRSIVRQDPDIIMVGEIRDRETADIAVQSALTGHLVFSTVHTNDAAGAITRLLDMGVEDYLLSSSIIGVLAQRLIRKVCSSCQVEDPSQRTLLEEMGFPVKKKGVVFYSGEGCPECSHTGYRGRIGIFELLQVTDKIRRQIMHDPSAGEIKSLARSLDMTTLRDDGLRKVAAGLSTVSEVVRVSREEE